MKIFNVISLSILFSIIFTAAYENQTYADPPFGGPPSGGLPACEANLIELENELIESQNELAECQAELFKRVFVTNDTFTADLGGANGADDKCNAAATTAGLTGTYKAWISTSTSSPSTTFTKFTQPYVLLDAANTRVADNYIDLITCNEGPGDECLDNPINVDEDGNLLPLGLPLQRAVWTNTLTDGTEDETEPFAKCDDFMEGGTFAQAGDFASKIKRWTEDFLSLSCGDSARLYCFEQ